MSTLILCGLTEEETQDFLNAERALLDEFISQKELGADTRAHTLRLRELPDPSETEKTRNLSRELQMAFGLGAQEFQSEFLIKNGFRFLAIYGGEAILAETEVLVSPRTVQPKKPVPRILWQIPAIAVGALAFLALLYYGIGFIITRRTDAQYSDRDCGKLVNLAESVEKAFPLKIAPFTSPMREQAEECRSFLNAEALYTQKDWNGAYQSYWKYQQEYPNGIFAKEAEELAADSLFAWASEQRGKQDFANAVDNLNLILGEYSDTLSMPKAKAALPEVYLEWGIEYRNEGKFSEAETVYLSLNEWGTQEKEQSLVTRARSELAQTYFDWGRDLQTKNDFVTASRKFDKAIETDPSPKSANSTALQTHAHLPGFQRAWGEYLIAQGKYPESINHFKTSIAISNEKDVESAKDALAQAYLKWADALRKKEDYNQALDRIDDANETAATDDSRKNVEDARSNTIDLFSRSKGSQAQMIITNTSKSICQSGKPVDAPPIIGVLDEKRLTVSGVDLSLSSNVLAQSPGNLHFVACAVIKEVTVATCPYSSTGFGTVTYWIKRIRYDWQFKIFRSQTGKLYTEKIFRGSSPETCPYLHSFSFVGETHYHYGNNPSATTIVDWLTSLLK